MFWQRHLEGGELGGHEIAQRLGAQVLARLGEIDHRRDFAEAFIRQAEARAFGDRLVRIHPFLDLDAGYVLAAADDDVLLAVDDEQISVLVEIAEVAGAEIAVPGEGRFGRLVVFPVTAEIGQRADAHLAHCSLIELVGVIVEDREIDQRAAGAPGAARLGHVVLVEVAAAHAVGFGEAIAQQREAAWERFLDLGYVIDRAWRTAGGEALASGQVELVAVGVRRNLVAHQRHADEVRHFLGLHQPHRLARIPLGHQHQLAGDAVALEEQRHLAGDVEQRHRDQRAGLLREVLAPAFHQQLGHRRLRDVAEHPVHHRTVIGPGALRLAGRTRGVEDRGEIVGLDLGEHGQRGIPIRPGGGKALGGCPVVRKQDDLGVVIGALEPRRAAGIGQHQRTARQLDAVGELVTGPEPVEQGGAAARHDRAHIGDDPVRRIARGDAHAVALLHAMLAGEPRRDMAGRLPAFAEGQPHVAVDQERNGRMLLAEMGEVVRQRRRRVLEGGDLRAVAVERHRLEGHARLGQLGHDVFERIVQFGRHPRLSPLVPGQSLRPVDHGFRMWPGYANSRASGHRARRFRENN